MTLTRRQLVDLLDRHRIRPRRSLGQNFVVDPNTVRRIARLADVGPGDRVVEVGAGPGSLTLALAETGASVTALEVDPRLVAVLREVVGGLPVEIVEGDALAVDWRELLGEPRGGWVMVGNLPYNIATPVVADLLDRVPQIARMLVMVQREVAERLAAAPGDEGYGAVSVKVAYWAHAELIGRVPPSVFLPRPNVESALVRIVRRATPAVDPAAVDAESLFTLVRAGFAQRRKMLRRALAGMVDAEVFGAAGIRGDARAEELGIEDWGRLAACTRNTGRSPS